MFWRWNVFLISVCFCAYIIECTPKKEDPVQIVKKYHLECIDETKADPGIVARIKKGDWKIPKAKLQQIKEWCLCVMMKAGLMTKQGVYKIDVALSQVPSEDKGSVENLIDTCLSKKAIPAPDIAMMFIKCYQKARGNYTVTVL
ncbi:uncharacterized protein LOC113499440 [Trichoplusia ni]|uniref:Uncharacterized protein LOC113499440 n=1 Tax=Trichoplusia ni TaxID=7111 RepID=A0A7E5W5G1_TRINI|nr:uncharacterized protein LOC113499440 [Trichoplusia ni]